MTDTNWLALTSREHEIILETVLFAMRNGLADTVQLENLALKLAQAQPHPDITVGVYGGLVQWIRGNPFPVRVCDYDGYDLPDLDAQGQPCAIWFEPATAGPLPK